MCWVLPTDSRWNKFDVIYTLTISMGISASISWLALLAYIIYNLFFIYKTVVCSFFNLLESQYFLSVYHEDSHSPNIRIAEHSNFTLDTYHARYLLENEYFLVYDVHLHEYLSFMIGIVKFKCAAFLIFSEWLHNQSINSVEELIV